MIRFTNIKTITIIVLCTLLSLRMQAAKPPVSSDLVISKVFYAGTTQAGSSRAYNAGEEYIELHNNTNKELILAGIYIGLVESENTTGAYTVADGKTALKQLYRIPTDYAGTIAPYGTITIAACAIDHSRTAENGPDLSTAELEFGGYDNDNPSVPDLELIFTFNEHLTKLNLTNGGDASVCIFQSKFESKFDLVTDPVYANGKDKGNKYLPVNLYYTLDCVDILKVKKNPATGLYEADAARKRFPDNYDRGYVHTPETVSMNKDGYVVYRKTAINNAGLLTLYDTGNSTIDFLAASGVAPKVYDAQVSGLNDTTVVIPESGYLPFNANRPFMTDNDMLVTYISGNKNKSELIYNNFRGDTVILSAAPYILIGQPGTHTIHYTEAKRTISTSGYHNWLNADDAKYDAAVKIFTETKRNRRLYKFINEKGNVRFERDERFASDGYQSLTIDPASGEHFFIELPSDVAKAIAPAYGTTDETGPVSLPWRGATVDDAAAADVNALPATHKNLNDDAVYNLQGVRMEPYRQPKGIYIRNGKKFIIHE